VFRYVAAELQRVVVRLAGAFIIYAALTRLPWPADLSGAIAVGAAALLATSVLIVCGTFLYNTLFFDRYWRQADGR
jgi:hypothetical protein